MKNFTPCPRCEKPSAAFIKIETGMRLGLQAAGKAEGLPDEVCPNCYQDLAQYVSEGARLRAEMKAKQANRANMWANRVTLIKQARELMAHRAFSEAALAYEKYLRIVEVVHDLQPGELNPDLFANSSKSKELTVVTSVYWDLLRIYDTHNRYIDRQITAAKKLAEFARHTPIFGDVARQALEFRKKAKQKEPFDLFLKAANVRSSRCFIASSAFNSHDCPEVQILCAFRDQILIKNDLGMRFIRTYYRFSPGLAEKLDHHPKLKAPIRGALRVAAKSLNKTFPLKTTPKI